MIGASDGGAAHETTATTGEVDVLSGGEDKKKSLVAESEEGAKEVEGDLKEEAAPTKEEVVHQELLADAARVEEEEVKGEEGVEKSKNEVDEPTVETVTALPEGKAEEIK